MNRIALLCSSFPKAGSMLATVALLGFSTAQPAAAQQRVMNFDTQTISRTPAPTNYTENGINMVITAPAGSTLFNAGNPSPGYAFNTGNPASALFTLTDALPFTANSIDVLSQGSVTLTFTGTQVGGATVSDTFTTNGNGPTFQTYSAPARFTNLQSFRLGYPGGAGFLAFDNIRLTPTAVTTVPEPGEWATMGMAAAGLSGLMIRARRRKASQSATPPA